ncbi:hypothetical protein [Rubritalea profundi]|nr:hypothetical protein [Rubritalea profundi]
MSVAQRLHGDTSVFPYSVTYARYENQDSAAKLGQLFLQNS